MVSACADVDAIAAVNRETDRIGGNHSLLQFGAGDDFFEQSVRMESALTVPGNNEWASIAALVNKVIERGFDILIGQIQRLRTVTVLILEAIQSGLTVPRCVNLATAVKDAGLVAHDPIVGHRVSGCIV